MASNREALAGKRLDSWKEIAAFLGRAERTVKRWETERGLPVHRVPGVGRSAVFAYSDELADWLKGRSQELEADESISSETVSGEIGSGEIGSSGINEPASRNTVPEAIQIAPIRPAKPTLGPTRLAAWLVPLALSAGLVFFFTVGHRDSHFKAMASRHTPNAESQELYLKGRYYWDRRTPEDLNQAVDYFTQAIVKDPSDAQAYVGLADCYNLLREFGAMPPSEAYPRALAAAQRAVELDDSSAEAHISLAFPTFWWSWQGATAEREFKRALELNPNLVRAHHWYATYLMAVERYPESLDQIEQAQRLDPSSGAILADKGLVLWHAGHRAEGLALLKQLETTQPSLSSTHTYLGDIFWRQTDYAKALAEYRRAAELRHDAASLALADAREKGFALNGLHGLYEAVLPLQKDLVDRGAGSAYALATTYAALGRKQEALASLQISFDRREADMLTGAPITLSDDPQYQKLRGQVSESLNK
ncbi:MAG TPA: tetratricopeptide repeat protein [Candidatus Sulfotelmatobacter sp.]|jgi:tetratricopeptide (TPR) repeat protein